MSTSPDAIDASGRRWWRLAPVAVAVLAFTLAVWAPGPTSQTFDEFSWSLRSAGFRGALADGNLEDAAVIDDSGAGATQPGVTTMWAGTIGDLIVDATEGSESGLSDLEAHARRSTFLRTSRVVVSLLCALALLGMVIVATRIVGRPAALVAGVLLATEPYLVGHSHVLHTDALVTTFGALSVVALLAALRDGAGAVRWRLILLSGGAGGVALLTKLSALPLLVGGAGMVLAVELVASRRTWRTVWPRLVAAGATWLGAGLVVSFALWPAAWVDPVEVTTRVAGTLDQLDSVNLTYFRGANTVDPGWTFYPYVVVYRLSPWLFLTGVASVVAVAAHLVRLVRRRTASMPPWPTTGVLVSLLLAPLPYLATITLTEQKYDRYVLPLVPYLALVVGVVVAVVASWAVRRLQDTRPLLAAAALATVVIATVTAAQAPYAISHMNPLFGGQRAALSRIVLGWGEGVEPLGAYLAQREGDRCSSLRVRHPLGGIASFVAVPCGMVATGGEPADYDYAIRYVGTEQLRSDLIFNRQLERDGELVREVRIGDVAYAQLWRVDQG